MNSLAGGADRSFKTLEQAYAVLHAHAYIMRHERKYSRIQERVDSSIGQLTRTVKMTWRLPTLQDLAGNLDSLTRGKISAIPDKVLEEVTAAIAKPQVGGGPQESETKRWIVPLTPMRRGHLYADLTVTAGRNDVRMVSRERSVALSVSLLSLEWYNVRDDMPQHYRNREIQMDLSLIKDMKLDRSRIKVEIPAGKLDAYVDGLIDTIVMGTPEEGEDAATTFKVLLGIVFNQSGHLPSSCVNLISSIGYLGKRRLIWIETDCQPGEVLSVEYRYRTRFAAEYGNDATSFHEASGLVSISVRRKYRQLRRMLGKTPATYYVPISRYGLCKSYHFTTDAPEDSYFTSFQFVQMESDGGLTPSAFHRSLDKAKLEHPQLNTRPFVEGEDEAGGPFGHLYSYCLPSRPRERVYVRANVAEIPPGHLGPTSWLVTGYLGIATFVFLFWGDITKVFSTLFLSVATLAVTFGAVWFGLHFEPSSRRRVPLSVEAALLVVAAVSGVTFLFLVLNAMTEGRYEVFGHTMRGLYGGLVFVLLLTTAILWGVRIAVSLNFRRGQKKCSSRYDH